MIERLNKLATGTQQEMQRGLTSILKDEKMLNVAVSTFRMLQDELSRCKDPTFYIDRLIFLQALKLKLNEEEVKLQEEISKGYEQLYESLVGYCRRRQNLETNLANQLIREAIREIN
jgi:hypothetical protein